MRRPARPPEDLDTLIERALDAEERLRYQTLLFAEAEHKLKTSLSVISGWAATLDDRWDILTPEQRRDGVATIRRSADNLTLQTRKLLEDARAEVARQELLPAELDLAEILVATTGTYDGLSASHRIKCDVSGRVSVWADPGGLQQVLGHLLENAVKYSPDGGTITIAARSCLSAGGAWAELTVSDEGIGIPDDINVFAAFTQGREPGSTVGVGLGLYIVQNLVEGMGGTVTAARNRHRGSTFTVLLPAVGR